MTEATSPAPAKAGLWTRITQNAPFLQTKKGIAATVVAFLLIIGGGLAGLAALHRGGNGSRSSSGSAGGSSDSNAITSDSHFYGLSPAFYPSRESCINMLIWTWLTI